MTTPTRTPRFNHVAMSVPSELLGEDGRRDLVRFYGEVFGWEELPTETVDGKSSCCRRTPTSSSCSSSPTTRPWRARGSTTSACRSRPRQELDDMLGRAKAFHARDDRVDIVDKEVRTTACSRSRASTFGTCSR